MTKCHILIFKLGKFILLGLFFDYFVMLFLAKFFLIATQNTFSTNIETPPTPKFGHECLVDY